MLMKNLLIAVTTAVIAVASTIVLVLSTSAHQGMDSELFEANVEVLLDQELDPGIITCDRAFCGSCWERDNAILLYNCNWTGRQEDYCDCDLLGFVR